MCGYCVLFIIITMVISSSHMTLKSYTGSDKRREDFTLQLLAKFKTKLHAIKEKTEEDAEKTENAEKIEDEDDINTDNWLGHKLRFEDKGSVLAKDASSKGDDWFDIYDPRNPINKRKREKDRKKK